MEEVDAAPVTEQPPKNSAFPCPKVLGSCKQWRVCLLLVCCKEMRGSRLSSFAKVDRDNSGTRTGWALSLDLLWKGTLRAAVGKKKHPITFSVLLHITNVLGTAAIINYNVNKSPNLSLHFKNHNQFPSTEQGNTVLKKRERLVICQPEKWLFCTANALRTAHPCLLLTVKSTYQCPTEVTIQFKLSAKAKLTKLSLS